MAMGVTKQFAHEWIGVGDAPGLDIKNQDAIFGRFK